MVVCECPHRSDARRLRICSTSSGADATAAPPVLWATSEVALPPPAADGGGKGAAGFLGWLASAADMAGGPCTPPEASYRRWCAVRLRVGLCTARGRLLVFGATPGGGRQHAASRWGRPAGRRRPGGRGVAGWACLGRSLTQHASSDVFFFGPMKMCAGLSKILLILGRLRRLLPGPKSDSVEIDATALF
jgi:hypothetical protein